MGYRKDYRKVPARIAKQVREEESYCARCFTPLPNDDDTGQVDHIIPDYLLGKDHELTRSDVQLLCKHCHSKKTKRETTKARRAAELRAVHPRRR